jgi:TolA-binding protein
VSKLDGLLRHVAEEQDAWRAANPLAERLASRFRRPAPRPRRRAPVWLALAAALSSVALFVAVRSVHQRGTLSVRVGGSAEAPLLGTWLGAPDSGSLPLDFSDGSRFELTAKSKARVVELSGSNARVELASGSLRVHVVPGGSAEWHIAAGPFGVRITGTRFLVSYVPGEDAFELSLDEGQVELSGCVFGVGRKLTAGQRVRASCATKQLEVSYRDTQARGASPESTPVSREPVAEQRARAPEALAVVVPEPGPKPRKDPAASSSAEPPSTWMSLASAGKYREAYAAVERDGFDAECTRGTPESLLLLADVARHARAPRQAGKALLTLRRRFPGGADAALAAFTLGRLEFDEFRSYPAAAGWFRTYLKERPGGTMAREALGRLMEALNQAGDLAGARATAADYLRDYPSGPHADLASRLAPTP